jgi:NAD(P)-dependent dehydrogenase (short-subunit alcohol dehydrogenase family)
VECDLSRLPESVDALARAVADDPLDVLVCNVGIWEAAAFGPGYRFESSDDAEIRALLDVNVASTLLLVRRLLGALRRSENPKVVVIGSISGLDNAGAREVAFVASKFAQRGIVHALREELRAERIGVCLVNPGYLATEEVLGDVGPGGEGRTVPLEDVVMLVRAVVATSRRACVKQIDVPAMLDRE